MIELCLRLEATSLLPIPRGPEIALDIGDFYAPVPGIFEPLFVDGCFMLSVSIPRAALLVFIAIDP